MRQPIVFGKYLLLERISVGGMAEVFKAKYFGEEGFEKILAIKRILPSMAEDDQFITMFIDEAKIAGDLAHPCIGQIYELGQIDNGHFIAMEYIWGKDVLQIQNRFRRLRQKMPIPMSAYIASRVCEGLDYAHRRTDSSDNAMHIIHRDVSPQNILVSYSGEVKIIDFGIAKARSRSSKTQAGVLKGKFGYMSPEQVRGLPLDQRSDIFSIGTLLWEMSTGERLFTGETDFATLDKVRNADVRTPSELNDAVPPELDAIILKALCRNPDDRYQWASEMQEALVGFGQAQVPQFKPKDLSGLVAQMFGPERKREQGRMEEYREITKDDMSTFTKPGGADQREVVMSLLPLDSVVSGEHQEVLVAADDSDVVSVSDEYDEDGATTVGQPGFFGGDDEVIDGNDLLEVLDEESDDGATMVFSAAEHGVPGTEPMTAEPTFIFNSETGQMVQSQLDAQVYAKSNGGHGELDTEMPDQGPTVLFDAQAVQSSAPQAPQRTPSDITPVGRPRNPMASTMPIQVPRRRSSLVKDILIGVLVAVVIILGIVVWRVLAVGGWKFQSPATLVITATPSRLTEVYVDGQLKGKMVPGTPFTLKDVSPQKHVIMLKPKGWKQVKRVVTLKPGDVRVVSVLLNTTPVDGKLALTISPAGAAVLVNGKPIKFSPGTVLTLAPGKAHKLQVQKDGFVASDSSFTLEPGKTLGKTVTLRPASEVAGTAAVQISTTPAGATVVLDGKGLGPTPVLIKELKPGSHNVSVSMQGYESRTEAVVLAADKTLELALVLKQKAAPVAVAAARAPARRKPAARARPAAATDPQPAPRFKPRAKARPKPVARRKPRPAAKPKPRSKPRGKPKPAPALAAPTGDVGYLVANTMPWGATVLVDGKNTGKKTPVAPRSKIALKPGKHRVTFVLNGKKHKFSVTITSGKTARLIKKLPAE